MIEVETPGGIVEFPDGTPTATIQAALRRKFPPSRSGTDEMNALAERAIQDARDEATIAADPVGSRIQTWNQGLPFVGEYYDDAIGLISPEAQDRVQAQQGAMARSRPGQTMALQTGAGVVGSIPLAAAAGPAVLARAPASTGARALAGAGAGMTAGGIEGTVSGFGEGDAGNVEGAITRGLIGAGMGGLVGAIAPVIAKGGQNAVRWLRGTDTDTIARELGVSKDAAAVIRDAVRGDNPGPLRGGDAMIADAGPGTRQLLDTVTASPGGAGATARAAVDDRASRAAARLTGALDASLGAPAGRADAAEAVRTGTAATRKAAYDRAFGAAIDYSSSEGRSIEALMGRLPPRQTQEAIRQANDLMRFEGRPGQVMAQVGPDGKVTFQEMPSAVQLHYIKRGFDAVAEAGKDAVTGRMSPEARLASNVARAVRVTHERANPAYRVASQLGGDNIRTQNAIETGYGALRSTREALARELRGATAAEREAARAGLRQAIDDTMARARTVLSDPSRTGEVAEAMTALNSLSDRATREKLVILMGRGPADTLLDEIGEVRTAFELRAAIARNSATAARAAGQRAIDERTAPGAIDTLMAGEPLQATKRVIQLFTGATKDMQQARKEGIYQEIARALTERRGPDADRAVRVVQAAIQGQPVSEAQARQIARALATGAGLVGYQIGTRSIQSPTR